MARVVAPIVALILLVAWIKGWSRPVLLDAVAAGLFGLGIVHIIVCLRYRPRPFEIGLGLNLMNHAPENSFSSDQATLMFALAVLLALSPLRKADLVLLPLALAVRWGRVYLGAQFPFDILGGAVIGAAFVLAVRAVPRRKTLWTLVKGLYKAVLARVV